jgi:hypothetical protein
MHTKLGILVIHGMGRRKTSSMKNRLKVISSLMVAHLSLAIGSYATLDNGVDPAHLGKGDWIANLSIALQQANATHPTVVTSSTDLAGFMELERSIGVRFIVVKAGTGSATYPLGGIPQFTPNLVTKAHEKCLKIFGYTRADQTDIPGEIALAASINNMLDANGRPADGFVFDAEGAVWNNGTAASSANLLCSGIRAQFPTRFLGHAPLAIISSQGQFPYKEFGKGCDAVMPQAYWQAWVGRTFCGGIQISGPQDMVDTLDCEWNKWQNSLAPADRNAIKPIAPIGWGCDAAISASTPVITPSTADIEGFINGFAADTAQPASPGGYQGVLFYAAGPLSGSRSPATWTGLANGYISQPIPDPYIIGGYDSVDVLLEDSSNPGYVPYGQPLTPLHPYAFSATIHNSSPTTANVTVRFWEFPGGVGSAGTLIASGTVSVPANSSLPFRSPVDFHSAAAGQHKCAVVSLSLAEGCGRCLDATTAAAVPDPVANVPHSCSAWRNTDSGSDAGSGGSGMGNKHPLPPKWPWKLNLALTWPKPPHPPGPGPDPSPEGLSVEVETRYVPRDWANRPENIRLKEILREAGAHTPLKPLYLLPHLRKELKVADLNVQIETKGKEIEVAKARKTKTGKQFAVKAPLGRNVPVTLAGTTPKYARSGDTFLILVTAHYPAWRGAPARHIEFTQFLHIRETAKAGAGNRDDMGNVPH